MSKSSVGVGVIGVGFVGGQAHAPAFRKIPNSRLVGLADIVEAKVKPLAEKYGVRYYLDYMELVENPEVDAVVVANPTPFHYKTAKVAIENGKHVMCEMPVAATINETEDLGRSAEKHTLYSCPTSTFVSRRTMSRRRSS